MRGPARLSRGVTLIEAMTVLAIVGVLTSLAAPSFQQMLQARRLSGAGSLLMADLQSARSEAVLSNSGITVTFLADKYQITAGSSVGSLLREIRFTGNGNSLTSGTGTTITYDPRRGTASPAASVTLSNGSHSLQIGVNTMGRVQCTVLSGSAKC